MRVTIERVPMRCFTHFSGGPVGSFDGSTCAGEQGANRFFLCSGRSKRSIRHRELGFELSAVRRRSLELIAYANYC